MKIEWLNADCTEAVVTKGWFRKHWARVRRITQEEWNKQDGVSWWRFVPSDRPFQEPIEYERRRELERRANDTDWQPVRSLPPARLIERRGEP